MKNWQIYCDVVILIQPLVNVLMAMENDEQGKAILKDIQIQGWTKSEAGELKMLQMVYDRYVK